MIGVVVRAEDTNVVEEFFELFKTPWEFYRPGASYDVVVSSVSDVPQADTRLLIVLQAAVTDVDRDCGFFPQASFPSAVVDHQGSTLPIYGEVLTFGAGSNGSALMTAGGATACLRVTSGDRTIIRVGYNLFEEVRLLLTQGQPIEHASVPTLDVHIQLLRNWILDAGIPLLEITPTPFGYNFIVCLTHDIDFAGIRRHFCDHTMWGFVYRATVGAVLETIRRRLSLANLFRCWWAVASLPLVFAGLIKDFWDPFEWYLGVEAGLPATYFLIPFKRTTGQKVPGPHASRRAAAYDATELSKWTKVLLERKCELGVHGIDAWHSSEKGKQELARISGITGKPTVGIRMHWLLSDPNTPSILEKGGYAYDSTCGYNETVGYRAGTSQVFRPLGTQSFFELPLHIQDGALFYPNRLNLSSEQANIRCRSLVENARNLGGVLTLLWHDRSHAPERFWGGFYSNLVTMLRGSNVWFGSGAQVVNWFSKRRAVRFERYNDGNEFAAIDLSSQGERMEPPLTVRMHLPMREGSIDIPYDGSQRDMERFRKTVAEIAWRNQSELSETTTLVRSSL